MEQSLVKREILTGARRFENYIWAIILFSAGIGFISTGISSYYKINLSPYPLSQEINFIPQGILMLFYGVIGFLLSIYLIFIIILDLGGGYNEFDKSTGTIRIVRKAFPGKNNILVSYSLNGIEGVLVDLRDGINPKREVYLVTIDGVYISLGTTAKNFTLTEIETRAITLAKFLDVDYIVKK